MAGSDVEGVDGTSLKSVVVVFEIVFEEDEMNGDVPPTGVLLVINLLAVVGDITDPSESELEPMPAG